MDLVLSLLFYKLEIYVPMGDKFQNWERIRINGAQIVLRDDIL